MAKPTYLEAFEDRNPTLSELARMPDYLRDFWTRYLPEGNPTIPTKEQVEEAASQHIQEEFETLAGKVMRRSLYFVQAETGQIKIGIATNLRKRMSGLQGASPVKLTLLLAVHGGRTAEATLHQKFDAHRLHGEWFGPAPEILAEIERLRAVHGEHIIPEEPKRNPCRPPILANTKDSHD